MSESLVALFWSNCSSSKKLDVLCTIFIELFLTANVIGYDTSNAVHWPPDGATNMPYKCFVNPANIAIVTAGLSEHSAQMYDARLVPVLWVYSASC